MRKQDETMKVIYYSWEESIQDLHELVRQMSIDRFRPQVIVGISRGGLPPAVMLSAYYDIPLKPLKASLRHFPQWEEYMPYPTDQDILIVDDICDSGATFTKIRDDILNHTKVDDDPNVRFASLYSNADQEFRPDYYVRELNQNQQQVWIEFPWKVWWKTGMRLP